MQKLFLMLIILFSIFRIENVYALYIEPKTIMGEGGELNMISFPGESVKPSALILLEHSVQSSIDLERNPHDGYENNDIQIEKSGNTLTITNSTPRLFNRIALTDGKDGFVLATKLGAFQELVIQINGNISNEKLYFLDPNPQFAYSVRAFHQRLNENHIKAYQVMNSGIKEHYKKISTRNDFFTNLDTLSDSEQVKLSKWLRTITFDTPVEHRILVDPSFAGRATVGAGWLSVNWPINTLINVGGNYPYAYDIYQHEASHTMGYHHGSGMTYKLGGYIQRGIAKAFRAGELTPFEMVNEESYLYSYFNSLNNSIAFYYDSTLPSDSISSIDLTGNKTLLNSAFANGNRIFLRNDVDTYTKFVVGTSTESGKLYHSIGTVGSIEADRNPYYLNIDETGSNVFDVSRNLIWYIPQQESVVYTDAQRSYQRRYWNSKGSYNEIVVAVKNESTGNLHNITLHGTKSGRILGEGSIGSRSVKFTYAPNTLDGLPDGRYSGMFDVVAAGWHVSSYEKRYPVKINFTIGEENALPLGEWSENYSNKTVTGNSSVYFYIPEQESIIQTTALRSESRTIWSGAAADTQILVKAIGDNGKTYSLPLIGNKKGDTEMLMGDGYDKGLGQVRVKLDLGSNHYAKLPYGQNYRAELVVKAASWHDNTAFPQDIVVPVAVYKQDPSERGSSVSSEFVIYDGFDYQGNAFTIDTDISNLESWANKMSSWRLPEGWQVRFYERESFTGRYYTRRHSGNAATRFNNKIRSVKILKRPRIDTIMIYDQANYRGESRVITRDVANLGNWDNKLSSWFLPEGWEVRFYEKPNFEGGYWSLAKSGNASGFDNMVSSIRILKRPEQLVIFDQKGFAGNTRTISADVADLGAWDGKLSSWMMPEGWVVRFFEHENFRGRYYTRRVNDDENGFGHQISSIQIIKRSDKLVISDVNGEAIVVNADLATLKDWDNRMTSWTIPEGWEVRFYENAHFSGPHYTRNTSGTATGFARRVSSIKILKRP